jgi:hypothetical protein
MIEVTTGPAAKERRARPVAHGQMIGVVRAVIPRSGEAAELAYDSVHGPAEQEKIHLARNHEIAHWTKVFGCSEDQLRTAVSRVGVKAEDVRRYLDEAAAKRHAADHERVALHGPAGWPSFRRVSAAIPCASREAR